MTEIVGIIPSAGRALRIGGFFKELTPINPNPTDTAKFIVVSERIVWQMSVAGAAPLYFVVSPEKSGIISEYYGRSNLFPETRLFFKVQGNLNELYGMPFAIESVFEDIRGKTVLLGMPDTLIEPDDAFTTLLKRFEQHESDLELGLFATRPDNQGGFITFDPNSGRVLAHVDKTSHRFEPENANNSWAIACWNGRFTQFMHEFVERKQQEYLTGEIESRVELLFGDIVDAALLDRGVKVCASFVSEDAGYYLDITDPDKYFQAVLHYHRENAQVPKGAAKAHSRTASSDSRPSVFISYSAEQEVRADDLRSMLESADYKPILDRYDIRAGQQFPTRIRKLIAEADFFVLLLSRASLESKWVVAEVALAAAYDFVDKERLLPVEIETIPDAEADSFPMISRQTYKWLDATGGLRPILDWLKEASKP